jgi:signal transduction histidine kinase/Tfp pilus assembly protein PilF
MLDIKKQLFVLLVYIMAGSPLLAQDNKPDSLQLRLKSLTAGKDFESDTAYINALNALAFRFSYSNADSAILIASQAVALSKKVPYPFGEAEAYKNLGLTYNITGNYDSALVIFDVGLKIALDKNLASTAGRIYHNKAIVYTNQGKYSPALENYFRALKMREASGEKIGESSSNNGIGTVYFLQGKYDMALRFYNRAMTIAKQIDYKRGIESGYANIGEIFFKQGKYDSARYNLQQALDVANTTNDLEILAFSKNLMGSIYLMQNNYEDALNSFRECGKVAVQLESKEYETRSLLGIGQVWLNRNNTDSALHYISKAYQIAEEIKYVELMRDGTEILSTAYAEKGDYKQALYYARQFKMYADSINNQEVLQTSSNLAAEYEYEKKELLLKANFDSKTTRQRWIIFSACAALFSSLVVVWLVYRSRQKEKRSNLLLQQQKGAIEKALADLKTAQGRLIQSEKMASLGELTAGIAHEIQNPLNFVNNFSEVSEELVYELKQELEKGDIGEAKAIALDIKQNLEKIHNHGKRASGIVKGMLEHSRKSTGQKELTDINALCDEYLRLAYHGLRAKDKSFNAKFETNFDNSIEKMNIVPQDIGRVVLNLINNAFYAVSERKKLNETGFQPTVTVSTKKENGHVLIIVADNGTGIPQKVLDKIFQPFFTTKPTGQGTGLGLSLAYDIVKAHGGELKVETREGENSEFSIQLPVD